MEVGFIIRKLKSMGDQKNVEGMGRFGIKTENNFGNRVTDLRKFAEKIGKNHELAVKLWDTKIRDPRMVAACIEDPETITEKQMDRWAEDFDSWDICDHCCGHLFDKTLYAYKKIDQWTRSEKLFVKRAGFSLIAWLAVHDKKKPDKEFEKLLEIIKKESKDDRNYVKKAVNWALRNIGKRNLHLNKKAIKTAREIKKLNTSAARWIANDAIRELTSEKVKKRLNKK